MAWKSHKQYRLPCYDYSQEGNYFITIVTKARQHYFGEIENGEMQFSPVGAFVNGFIDCFTLHRDVIRIDEWQVMPNHVHLIISIRSADEQDYKFATGLQPLQKNSVSSFANHLKGKITRWCKQNNLEFGWQLRYHDRIIRDAEEYQRIKKYVAENPDNWLEDNER